MLIAIVLDRPLAEAQALVNYSRCLHPRTHHNHTRQETSPGHCPNDPAGHKRRCSTRGGCNEFLPKLQPTSCKSTPPHTFAYPIPIRTRGQREVLTVATHRYRSRSLPRPTSEESLVTMGYSWLASTPLTQRRWWVCQLPYWFTTH